jgi:hypothetical protein
MRALPKVCILLILRGGVPPRETSSRRFSKENAMRHAVSLFGSLALSTLLWAGVRADEKKVELEKVPKAVKDAVKKRFPKGEMKEASTEKDKDGKAVYEVTVKEGGKNIDVTLTPDGTIVTIEKEIAAKDLPKVVTEGLEKKYPKATYKFVEEFIKVEAGKETLAYYEVLLVTTDKKTLEGEINLDGTIKNVEDKTAAEKKDK